MQTPLLTVSKATRCGARRGCCWPEAARYAGQSRKRKRPVDERGKSPGGGSARRPLGLSTLAGLLRDIRPEFEAYSDGRRPESRCGQACGLIRPCLDPGCERQHREPACSKLSTGAGGAGPLSPRPQKESGPGDPEAPMRDHRVVEAPWAPLSGARHWISQAVWRTSHTRHS